MTLNLGGRRLVVVDCETTGLDVLRHWPIEIAAVDVVTGEEFYFVPKPPDGAFDDADGAALALNRYFERRVFDHIGETSWYYLWLLLRNATFSGSNPTFDATMLLRGYKESLGVKKIDQPWHHRLCDLAAYAAPAMGVPPTQTKGLKDVCDALGVPPGDHTALGDVRATADCFRKLIVEYNRGAVFNE